MIRDYNYDNVDEVLKDQLLIEVNESRTPYLDPINEVIQRFCSCIRFKK